MSKRHRSAHPCPTATKSAWPDQASANAALAYLASIPPRELDGPRPVRSYRCACGAWHLTSSRIAYSERPTVTAPTPRVLAYNALPDQWSGDGVTVNAEDMPDE